MSVAKIILWTSSFFLFVATFGHRLIGAVINFFLEAKLKTELGAFDMTVDWVTLRMGFDHNEVIVSNFIWHNPPQFEKAPFFLKLEQVSIVVDLRTTFELDTLVRLIASKLRLIVTTQEEGYRMKCVKIKSIDIRGIKVFFERGRRRSDGLNLWRALGSVKEEEEEEENRKDLADYLLAVGREASVLDFHDRNHGGIQQPQAPSQEDTIRPIPDEPQIANINNTCANKKSDHHAFKLPNCYDIGKLTLHDLELHTQDFIAAHHIQDDKLATIKIRVLSMNREDLLRKKKRGSYGVPLKLLIENFVFSAVAELFRTNNIAM